MSSRYALCCIVLMSSLSAVAADKLKTGLSNLAASLNDVAKQLSKAQPGKPEKKPDQPKPKPGYAEIKDKAIAFLVDQAQKGKKFNDVDAVLAELDKQKINPRSAAVDQTSKTPEYEKEFADALEVAIEPAGSPKRIAYVFEETLSSKLADVEADIRRKIVSTNKPYGSVEEIRAEFGKQIESALPAGLSALLEITAVNDYLRQFVGVNKFQLLKPSPLSAQEKEDVEWLLNELHAAIKQNLVKASDKAGMIQYLKNNKFYPAWDKEKLKYLNDEIAGIEFRVF